MKLGQFPSIWTFFGRHSLLIEFPSFLPLLTNRFWLEDLVIMSVCQADRSLDIVDDVTIT